MTERRTEGRSEIGVPAVLPAPAQNGSGHVEDAHYDEETDRPNNDERQASECSPGRADLRHLFETSLEFSRQ